ncbi:MAG: hypothetical protein J7K87_03445 [Candidatus Aenigmarchaeota archaeon]|nr:hypothetical protein [Candidatus Aenigmarchaeota archaeon]
MDKKKIKNDMKHGKFPDLDTLKELMDKGEYGTVEKLVIKGCDSEVYKREDIIELKEYFSKLPIPPWWSFIKKLSYSSLDLTLTPRPEMDHY